jgi:hypothetical protein
MDVPGGYYDIEAAVSHNTMTPNRRVADFALLQASNEADYDQDSAYEGDS